MNHLRYILGAPVKRADQAKFEEALLARFGGDMERAVAYMDKVTDSQISRASGILASTSLLAGMSYFVNAPFALITSLISIVLIASNLYVPWPSTYGSVGEVNKSLYAYVNVVIIVQ